MATISAGRLALLIGAMALGSGTLVVVAASPAQAADVYRVSPSGDDNADGVVTPWRTIRQATSVAPDGATILVDSGTYQPFVVNRPGQTVAAAPGQEVVVRGRTGVPNVVLIAARDVTLSGMTVTGCVPDPVPVDGLGDGGSSAIRVDDGAFGATVSSMTIRDSRGTNNYGLPFGCYGVFVHGADEPVIVDNDISGTGAGIYLNGGSQGGLIAENRIYGNDVLIRNTPGGDDDYGGNAIVFANVNGPRGVLATRNTISGSSGPSQDYDYDGGAFEIFDSSQVKIVGNTLVGNENVLETGSSPDSVADGDCVGNVFTDNRARGRVPGSKLARSIGLILRCASGMVISRNTFTDLDYFVYYISDSDAFASSVDGLMIKGNLISQFEDSYHLDVDMNATTTKLETNTIHFPGPVPDG